MSTNKRGCYGYYIKIEKTVIYKYLKIKVFFVLMKNVSFCFCAEKIYDKMSKNLESKDLEG